MKRVLVFIAPLFLLLASCSSTNVLNSWKDKDLDQASLEKVMVLAMVPEKQRVLRQELEYKMVKELQDKGFTAFSSLEKYGPKSFIGLTEKQAMEQLQQGNVDGVITVSLQDTETTERYVPGNVRYEPYAVRYNRFWRTYQTFYSRHYTPGYTNRETNYFFETNLFDVANNKLLYSVQSKSFDPSSATQVANEVSRVVVKDMQKHNILQLTVARH